MTIQFPLLLAVASKDRIAINEHFGHARQFHIYNVSASSCQFVETREVSNYCLGEISDDNAMVAILAAIADCYAVFVARIGDDPTAKVNAIGVKAVSDYAYAALEDSLLDYASKCLAESE